MSIVWSLEDTQGKESALYLATTNLALALPPRPTLNKNNLRVALRSAIQGRGKRREGCETQWWATHAITLAHLVCVTQCWMCYYAISATMLKEIQVCSLAPGVHSHIFSRTVQRGECDFLRDVNTFTHKRRKTSEASMDEDFWNSGDQMFFSVCLIYLKCSNQAAENQTRTQIILRVQKQYIVKRA